MAYNITDIENITEDMAREIAEEQMEIKGHNIYLVDFGGYFGYSMLVFLNGGHLYYANDYQLHNGYKYEEKGKPGLREYYIKQAKRKLFTEEEMGNPLKSYGEYELKGQYIRNYYPMQKERESIFAVNPSEEERRAFKEKTKDWTFNPIGFCYMPDKDFVKRNIELADKLEKAKEKMKDDFEYNKSAFLYEMYNHEYGINWQADYDTLSAFGNIVWHGESDSALEEYFEELGFTETQRKAYRAARKQYWDEYEEV